MVVCRNSSMLPPRKQVEMKFVQLMLLTIFYSQIKLRRGALIVDFHFMNFCFTASSSAVLPYLHHIQCERY